VDDDGKTKEELLRELRELRRQHSDMDITNADRKQSLACPPPGEAFFRSFIENGLDIITVLDANGRLFIKVQALSECWDTFRKN
jgi:hypothetical protein